MKRRSRKASKPRAQDAPPPGADVYHLLGILARVTRRIVDADTTAEQAAQGKR